MFGLGTKYAALVACVVTMFINFVACGSQLYKISLDGDTQVKNSHNVEPEEVKDPASPTYGLRATGGWVDLPIHFKVSKELSADQKAGLLRAMKAWELAVGRSLFVFDGADDRTGDSFPDLYTSLNDSVNGYYLDDNWAKTGKSTEVLATTIWNTPPTDPLKLTQSDIRFNSHTYLMGDSLTTSADGAREIVDMQTLAMHELGHMLGLAHIDPKVDADSIMVPSVYIGQGLTNRHFSAGDLERIQKIYPCAGDACDHAKVIAAITALNKADTKTAKASIVEQDTAH